jgi:hypothetical protein
VDLRNRDDFSNVASSCTADCISPRREIDLHVIANVDDYLSIPDESVDVPRRMIVGVCLESYSTEALSAHGNTIPKRLWLCKAKAKQPVEQIPYRG